MASARAAWRFGWAFAGLAACASESEAPSLRGAPVDGGIEPAADAATDAASGGDAGTDAGPFLPDCNDHDPCTVDRNEAGACVFAPAEDGRPCDDGDLCTLGDRCEAGKCVSGGKVTGPLAQVGTLKTLGGGGMGAVGNRFLAITGPSRRSHLELAERRSGKLASVAVWDGELPYTDAAEMLVRPLANDVVALGARGQRKVAVLSVHTPPGGPASIVKRSEPDIPGQLNGLAAHGHRIWACTTDFPSTYSVALIDTTDPDAPAFVGSMPLPNPCGSVVVSDDGDRVYVNTGAGVRFIDASPLSSGGDPTLSDVIAPSSGLSAGNGYLILRGDPLRVLKQSDLSEVASIATSGVQSAAIVGGRLLVEGWRKAGAGLEAFTSLYGNIGTAPPVKLDEIILETRAFQGDIVPVHRTAMTADGSAVITGDGQRWFELTSGHFVESFDPRLTSFDQAFVTDGGLRAVGAYGSALIDVTNATAPRFVGGGGFGRVGTLDVRLEEGAWGSHLLFGTQALAPRVATGRSWEPPQLPIERWRFDDPGQVQVAGSFRVSNLGSAELFIAGDVLYRFRHATPSSAAVTLLAWPVAALGREQQLAEPAFELLLSASPPPPGDGGRSAFHVDDRTRRAVVATGTNTQTRVSWLDLSASPPTVLEDVIVEGPATDVRVSGSRAVLSTGLELVWLELGKGLVGRVRPSGDIYVPHLLGFDGKAIYFASSFPRGIGTAVFGSTMTPAPTELDDEPSSLVETSSSLVVVSRGTLVTMHPRCE